MRNWTQQPNTTLRKQLNCMSANIRESISWNSCPQNPSESSVGLFLITEIGLRHKIINILQVENDFCPGQFRKITSESGQLWSVP